MSSGEVSRGLQARFVAAIREYAVVQMDTTGRVLTWNAGAERIYGYSPDEVVGRPADMLFTTEDVARGLPAARLADARALGSLTYECWRSQRTEGRFWAHVVLSAVFDGNRELLGFGEVVRDDTNSRKFQHELLRRALHDPLTGLPNRTLMLDRLRKALERATRNHLSVVLFFLDLNGFKTVNDRFGHCAGDRVLVATAERLLSAVRAQDTVARFGGDEFVVVCEALDGVGAAAVIADRLAETLAAPFICSGSPVLLGASVGVTITGGDPHLPEWLLADADAAMYHAKNGDPTRLVRFTMHDHSTKRGGIERQSSYGADLRPERDVSN